MQPANALHQLASPAEAAAWLRARVTGKLTTDSRSVQPGDGFIAWPGAATDGRKFVGAAIAQGADACLVEYAGASEFAYPAKIAATTATYVNLKAASGPIADAYFGAPSKSLDLVAITGTNGKTSTAWWLAHALSNLPTSVRRLCGLVGTLGVGMPQHSVATIDPNQFSFDVQSNGLTTPDPVLLQHSLRTFVSSGLTACAIEASSIGLAEHRMDGTHIRVAVFTNFTQDHLDYHGSMQAYWEAKKTLFQWPGLHAAVINIDDEKGAELAHELACSVSSANLGSGVDVWTVSCQQPARVVAHNIGYDAQGLHFTVREGAQSHMLATRLVGQYNVSNLLGVIAAMRALDVPLQACVDVCASLESVPGRLQCLGGAHEPMVVVDYAHTPDALAKTLEALRPLANVRGGKLWCVFGCGGNRDASKRPLMGAVAARHADQTVVTSDNPRSEKPQAIISQILLGMAGQTAVRVQADRALAVAEVIQSAERADVVLVAGKGHETFQEVDGQKLPFVDAQHVLAALALRGTALAQTGATN